MSEKPVRDPQAAPELAFSNVCKSYGRAHSLLQRFGVPMPRRVVAVDGVSFTLRKGETLALVGESGCGKSTIARLAVGLERPDSGTVLLDGAELGGRNRPQRRGSPPQMIFQDPYASLDPHWRVDRILAEPLRARGIARDSADRACRIADWLRQVGLTPADGRKYPHEFSGGQRQRISIARALAAQPELLVCDEPTSALDVSVQAQVLNLLLGLRDRLGLACLFISHDLAVVYQVSDHVGVLYLGRLVELAPASRLFAAPRHPYTRMLLDAVPRLEEPGVTAAPIPGEVPDPFRRPAGCCFHPRCAFATERCRTERPKLLADRDGEVACHAVAEGRLPPYEYRAIAAGA